MKIKFGFPYILLLPTIISLLAIGIFPLIYSLYYSLTDLNLFYIDRTKFIGVNNFLELLTDKTFLYSFLVTIKFTAVVVPVETLLGLGLALLFKEEMRGETIIRTIMMIPMMIAPIAAGYLWKHLFWPVQGIIDIIILRFFGVPSLRWTANPTLALPSLMIIDTWQWTPFTFLILLSGLRAVPKGIFEAAEIDGAGRWGLFRYVTLPLMKKLILVVVLFRLIDSIRVFDLPYIVTYGGPGYETYTASFFLYVLGLKETFNIGEAAAGSWILNIFIMILVLALLRVYTKREIR
ncbi:MAG: sugar ABC transporter permease [Candidatus Bathyarchaeia archaeon]